MSGYVAVPVIIFLFFLWLSFALSAAAMKDLEGRRGR